MYSAIVVSVVVVSVMFIYAYGLRHKDYHISCSLSFCSLLDHNSLDSFGIFANKLSIAFSGVECDSLIKDTHYNSFEINFSFVGIETARC